MPDIAMCGNRTCKSRLECYRYRAIPNGDRQSWASFEPDLGEDRCVYFAAMRVGSRVRSTKEIES